jgi:hypothetical protein
MISYISIQHTALSEDFRFVVVVDTKTRKEDFVLVSRDCTGEFLFSRSLFHSTFEHKSPECGIVEVVDVTWVKSII